jgi:UPF0042 nucleotide-binding protein
MFRDLFEGLSDLTKHGYDYDILFLDANDSTLIKRFKETRRTHPLSRNGSIEEGIFQERKILEDVKKKSTYIIDTSSILVKELKEIINRIFVLDEKFESIVIKICSFGFKYGIPADCDLVFDVRFLPNPYYIPSLKSLTGNDDDVYNYVMRFEVSRIFLDKVTDLLDFLIPKYVKEGKTQLVIGIGCTGGKHRSVSFVNALYSRMNQKRHNIIVKHNDIDRDIKNGK